jgi:hypothetical protein
LMPSTSMVSLALLVGRSLPVIPADDIRPIHGDLCPSAGNTVDGVVAGDPCRPSPWRGHGEGPAGNRWFADSSLERRRFELSVPPPCQG